MGKETILPLPTLEWKEVCQLIDRKNLVHRQVYSHEFAPINTSIVNLWQVLCDQYYGPENVRGRLVSDLVLTGTENVGHVEIYWAGYCLATMVNQNHEPVMVLSHDFYQWFPLFSLGTEEAHKGLELHLSYQEDCSPQDRIHLTAIVGTFEDWRLLPLLLHCPLVFVLDWIPQDLLLLHEGRFERLTEDQIPEVLPTAFAMTHPLIPMPDSCTQYCEVKMTVESDWLDSLIAELPGEFELNEDSLINDSQRLMRYLPVQIRLHKADVGEVAHFLIHHAHVNGFSFAAERVHSKEQVFKRHLDNEEYQRQQYQVLCRILDWHYEDAFADEEEEEVNAYRELLQGKLKDLETTHIPPISLSAPEWLEEEEEEEEEQEEDDGSYDEEEEAFYHQRALDMIDELAISPEEEDDEFDEDALDEDAYDEGVLDDNDEGVSDEDDVFIVEEDQVFQLASEDNDDDEGVSDNADDSDSSSSSCSTSSDETSDSDSSTDSTDSDVEQVTKSNNPFADEEDADSESDGSEGEKDE